VTTSPISSSATGRGLTLVRTTPYEGADATEGSEHGEAEYALTRPEWESRAGNAGTIQPR